ncbi:MAG: gamma-glutamyltransferase [Limisphaerales bacterium]
MLRLAVIIVGVFLPFANTSVLGREIAVATVHPLATQAGIDAYKRGGNAVDAAVASALMLGVVDGHNSGIGGGCLALVRLANGRWVALDGRETAPQAATRDLFIRDGVAVPALSQEGPLAVGVPGELAALDWLARRHGQRPLREALLEAARVADDGFPVGAELAGRLRDEAPVIRRHAEAASIFLHPDGSPLEIGERLRQPDLARSYRAIAEKGTRWFYRGDFADRVESWMRSNDGILRKSDLARYRVVAREPVFAGYRDCQVAGFPPPSSGGIHVAQILQALEGFDLRGFGAGSADLAHVTAEVMKRAFADRAFWLGDSDHVAVPRGLTSPEYTGAWAKEIRMESATPVPGPGTPPGAWTDHFGRHTTHLSAADSEGNWVALTATINTTLGSKVVIPGTGIPLNNEMDDFSAQPGRANYFGLVGAEANAVAPGKRPLSSMSPTIVLREGRPILAVGAAGGPTIISQSVLAVIQTVDFALAPAEALAQPRIHHQWKPDEVWIETGWKSGVVDSLRDRGHQVREIRHLGAAQAVGRVGTELQAASDPRLDGLGAVWRDQVP